MGAAVVYSGIIVVVFWHTRRQWIRVLAAAVAVLIPAFVGFSRIYRGMHFLTDVVFGALLGGAAVFSTAVILRRAAVDHPEAISSQEHPVDLQLEPAVVGQQ
jgi:undecaprenyl-diphosphatase